MRKNKLTLYHVVYYGIIVSLLIVAINQFLVYPSILRYTSFINYMASFLIAVTVFFLPYGLFLLVNKKNSWFKYKLESKKISHFTFYVALFIIGIMTILITHIYFQIILGKMASIKEHNYLVETEKEVDFSFCPVNNTNKGCCVSESVCATGFAVRGEKIQFFYSANFNNISIGPRKWLYSIQDGEIKSILLQFTNVEVLNVPQIEQQLNLFLGKDMQDIKPSNNGLLLHIYKGLKHEFGEELYASYDEMTYEILTTVLPTEMTMSSNSKETVYVTQSYYLPLKHPYGVIIVLFSTKEESQNLLNLVKEYNDDLLLHGT
jgi:hypothetical protein